MNTQKNISAQQGQRHLVVGCDVIAALIAELGENCVLTGAAVLERQTTDWSGASASTPVALVLPRTPAKVAQAVRICMRFGQPLCVQGGLTGLAGGANPQNGEIILSLQRLNAIEDFDSVGGTVVVQAGVTLEQLQTAATQQGWFFPLDLGARGSCQLGGNAAINAGGNRVLRYGMMRESVLGLEVALADGTLLTMLDRVIKNNAGFDLKHLFVGTEGTLGIITRLSLKLAPAPLSSCTVLCAVNDFTAATQLLREARRRLPELSAFELMWSDFFEASAKAIHKTSPFSHPYPLYVLIETLGGDADTSTTAIEHFLETEMENEVVADAVVAQSVEQATQLWAFREGVSELLSHLRPCAAFDVSVAIPKMDDLVCKLRSLLEQKYPTLQHLFFGHLGDGNLHLICGPLADTTQLEVLEELVYQAVGIADGSISAEHGIGMVKKPFIHHSRDTAELHVMRQLKHLLDPGQILNPGRVVDVV